ncbi:23S rRNA (uracil(1939)-C(5))-methyltransferase RlmD [Candidatus Peregrinibacteria bacterium]|nr:23S rRNA (uracil(1939)-C(5))-methyltransferase RlmD [Candidatus Peregrinibacteria bacterium]
MGQNPFKKLERINVKIEKLAFGGAGIGYIKSEADTAKPEDAAKPMVVFVEDTVPGDEITAEIRKIKPNYLEAKLTEIVKPSAFRIEPRCKHFNICGGCSLQNLNYDEQLKIKENQVREALSHIGGIKDPPVLKIIGYTGGENGPWFYRNKMEFSFGTGGDGNATAGGNVTLGLHPKHYRYDVFQLEECFLENSDIGEMVRAIAEFMNEKDSGLLKTFTVREGKRTGERMVNLTVSDAPFLRQKEFVEMLTRSKKFKAPNSVYLTNQIIKKGHRTELIENLLFGEAFLKEKMMLQNGSTLEFEIFPQSFFQPNTLQAEILYQKVIDMGEIENGSVVYDLFCGTGTIGLFAAHRAGEVLGVDINESAIKNARANAEKNGIKNVKYYIGDVFKVITGRTDKPDVVIVDPPRAGLGDKLCGHLLEVRAPKIVYVSCNPGTLARDLKILCAGKYNLAGIQPVDMFPQTYHIETVCELKL